MIGLRVSGFGDASVANRIISILDAASPAHVREESQENSLPAERTRERMSDFCPVYDWDYTKMEPIVHYNCIPFIYWLPYFFAGLAAGALPFILYLIRQHRINSVVLYSKPST